MRLVLLVCLLVACRAQADDARMVAVDSNGDLRVTPPAGRAVLVQGVDVPAALTAVDRRLRALETRLFDGGAAVIPDLPTGQAVATDGVPQIGQDLLGNLLLVPAPSSRSRRK